MVQITPPPGGFSKAAFSGSPLARGAVDKIFKEFYLPGINDLLNSSRVLSAYVQTSDEGISGKQAVIALRKERNERTVAVEELGYLPEPGRQGYDNATYRVRYVYNRILFSGPAAASSRNTRGAWVPILDAEMAGATQDVQHEVNRMRFGNGRGALAVLDNPTGSGADIPVRDPGGFANQGPGTQYLRPGMLISFQVPASGAFRVDGSSNQGFIISSVDQTNNTIQIEDSGGTAVTLGDLVSEADGDLVCKASRFSGMRQLMDTGYENEPWGLAALVNSGNPATSFNVGGIDATTEAIWNAPVIDDSGGGTPVPFNQGMFQRAMDKLQTTSDSRVQLFLTTFGNRRSYLDTLTSNKRFVGTMEMDGGFSAVTYDTIPIVPDKDCTRGYIYGLNFETLKDISETDWFWIDQDGSVLRRLPDQDAFQAVIGRYFNFVTNARNKCVVIKGIEDV